MDSEILVCAEGLGRRYGEVEAVRELSFELRRGEVLGLLGPNGAGKSTTLRVLAGTLAPSAGRVRVHGLDILDRPLEVKRRIGYLPEQPPLYRELTVNEHLGYCARLHRVPRREVSAAVARVKGRCGLAEVGRRLLGNLSKGYQQRVGIAQALVHDPSVVILDEPTVGLDPIQIREIRALIRELGGERGVLLSTHILPEVQAVCDRVLILHQGRLALDQAMNELPLAARPPRLRVVLGHPPGDAELLALPGVEEVRHGDAYTRLLRHAGPDPVPELLRRSLEGTWELRELAPERPSLEEVFVRLTLGETPADPGLET